MSAHDRSGRPGRIPVPRAVYVGIKAVRDSGLTNMLDWPRVAELALELGHPETAAWIRANEAAYARGVFNGIRPDDMPEPAPEPVPVAAALEQIAREELGIETLAERRSDRLDFHDVGVAGLRRALRRAYEMGREAGS